MPKWRKVQPIEAPDGPAKSIVAAAQRILPGLYGDLNIAKSAWQPEGWRQYDINFALAFGARWLGSALSRCRLVAVDLDDTGNITGPTKDEDVINLVKGLAGSPGKQVQLLQSMGPHLTVPGDCYVIATIGRNGEFDTWNVYSTEEVRQGPDRDSVIVDIGDKNPRVYNVNSALVIRIYRPHPRRSWEADSPTRSALPLLREMEQLTKHIFATIDSRLAGAGILLLPSELDFPSPQDEIQPGESPFVALLSEAMMASIKDRGDARAVVPIVAQGPRDAIGAAQWLVSPAMELTPVISELREKALRNLAIALDMPPEVLLGIADGNHWSSWMVEETAIKIHITPVMTLICGALTDSYLIPAMEAAGIDPTKFAIWFDPTDLVLRPNRATDAKDLYDRGELSGSALRRETGFTEEDAPAGKEKAMQDLYKLITASPRAGESLLPILIQLLDLSAFGVTPEQIQEVIQSQGVDGTPPKAPDAPAPNADPNAPPTPGANGNQG